MLSSVDDRVFTDLRFVVELFLNSLPQSDLNHEKETVDKDTETRIDTLIEYLTEV